LKGDLLFSDSQRDALRNATEVYNPAAADANSLKAMASAGGGCDDPYGSEAGIKPND
jgi:hypothetical protein